MSGGIRKRDTAPQKRRIQEVADAAGVSFITAWRVFNAPDMVREATRTRVMEAANEVGYVANAIARSLVTSRSNAVGIVIPSLEDSVFSATVDGLSAALATSGIEILIGLSNYSEAREEELVRAFLGRQVDALILTGQSHLDGIRQLLRKVGITVIEIWDVPDEPLDLYVGFSNQAMSRAATEWLITRGYRRIAFVTQTSRGRAEARISGFRGAMRDAGIESMCQMLECEPTLSGGAAGFDTLMSGSGRPDAILFNGDTPAVGAHLHGAAQGYVFPDDVALMGIHDTDIAAHVTPGLTTVRIPRYEIGRVAGEVVLERLKGQEGVTSRRVEFEIVVRGTA